MKRFLRVAEDRRLLRREPLQKAPASQPSGPPFPPHPNPAPPRPATLTISQQHFADFWVRDDVALELPVAKGAGHRQHAADAPRPRPHHGAACTVGGAFSSSVDQSGTEDSRRREGVGTLVVSRFGPPWLPDATLRQPVPPPLLRPCGRPCAVRQMRGRGGNAAGREALACALDARLLVLPRRLVVLREGQGSVAARQYRSAEETLTARQLL